MKIVQSFWSGPKLLANEKNALAIPAGWISPEYHWMSWALSCLQLTKYYDRVELVTDEPGRRLLIDTLGLPYSSVSTALQNSELNHLSPKLWAMAKIYTYGLQQEPFLHVDGDIYIAAPFSKQLMSSPIITQNPELDLPTYAISLQHIEHYATYLPPSLVQDRQHTTSVLAYNAGILGGTRLDFFREFKQEAFNFIKQNEAIMPQLLLDECFNTIPEQYLLHTLAQERGVPIVCLFEEPVTEIQQFEQFVDVQSFPHRINYIHLIGAFKKLKGFYDFVANTLRQEYPAYYYKILRLCSEQGITLYNQMYHLPSLDPLHHTLESYQALATRYLINDSASITDGHYSIRAAYEGEPTLYFATTLRVLAALPTPVVIPQPLPTDPLKLELLLTTLAATITNEPIRQLVLDVLNYEAQRIPYLARLGSDQYLYGREVAYQSSLTYIATLTLDKFFAQHFYLSTTIGWAESYWDWTHTEETDWALKVRDLSEIPANKKYTAWIPNLASLRLYELSLDEFDAELIQMCRRCLTGEAILKEISQQFPKEEVSANWDTFLKMVYFSLDRGIFYGLIKTKPEHGLVQ
jgi:hypothetical protein